jgi:hypothetical protein
VLAVLAAIVVIIAGYATWANVQPYTLQASVRIRASPQRVWAVLTSRPGAVQPAGGLHRRGGPTLRRHLHTDTLPMFRAMNAALAQQASR